jgi:hypothetical protein
MAYRQSIVDVCSYGHLELLNLILEDPEADPSIDGNLPLKVAVANSHPAIVARLLADLRVDPNAVHLQEIRSDSDEDIAIMLRLARLLARP